MIHIAITKIENGKKLYLQIKVPVNKAYTVGTGSYQLDPSLCAGARVNIPPISMMKNEITVAGDKENVAKAVAQIQAMHANMVIN